MKKGFIGFIFVSIMIMASSALAFTVGDFKADNWLNAYAPDTMLTSPLLDNDLGTSTRMEYLGTYTMKDYKGSLNFAYRSDLDEQLDSIDGYDMMVSYKHPMFMDNVYGIVQYNEQNDFRYKQNIRVGVGINF